MSIIVETGSIVAGAETYVSVTDADTYHSNRNNTAWAAAITATKEAALRAATAYVDGKYRKRWKGRKVQPVAQPLEWPRTGVSVANSGSGLASAFTDVGVNGLSLIPYNQIPQRLKDATCEAALRALAGPLSADAASNIKREKLDVMETEYFSPSASAPVYPVIDNLLSDYIQAIGSNSAVRG